MCAGRGPKMKFCLEPLTDRPGWLHKNNKNKGACADQMTLCKKKYFFYVHLSTWLSPPERQRYKLKASKTWKPRIPPARHVWSKKEIKSLFRTWAQDCKTWDVKRFWSGAVNHLVWNSSLVSQVLNILPSLRREEETITFSSDILHLLPSITPLTQINKALCCYHGYTGSASLTCLMLKAQS